MGVKQETSSSERWRGKEGAEMGNKRLSEQIKSDVRRLDSHIKQLVNADCHTDERDDIEDATYHVVAARYKLLFAAKILDGVGL